MKLAILGAGAWGTALAVVLAARHQVRLWARDRARCAELESARENRRYLPGIVLPDAVRVDADLPAAVRDADLAIAAVTVSGLRPTVEQLAASSFGRPLIWLCKGFEAGSATLPHQVVEQALPAHGQCGVLSGPSFALEVARGKPAAVTLASRDAAFAADCARELHTPRLRVYSSDDVVGVEAAGAIKNVIAIAAGICDGLGLGDSARAALITRGLAEITRLGVKLGGRPETFMGLAGAGDLILTCTGLLSRNRQVGLGLAGGKPLAEILRDLGHVAEGVHTAREVQRLSRQLGVEMPISDAVCRVLHEGLAPQAAVEELLRRDPKAESAFPGAPRSRGASR